MFDTPLKAPSPSQFDPLQLSSEATLPISHVSLDYEQLYPLTSPEVEPEVDTFDINTVWPTSLNPEQPYLIPFWSRQLAFLPSETVADKPPAALFSETAPALPVPDWTDARVCEIWETAVEPHLGTRFQIHTPINTDRLEEYLKPHPNRPLVESVLTGLWEGFYAGGVYTDLQTPRYVPPNQSSAHDSPVLQKERDEERKLHRLSAPFSTLSPFMQEVPTFTVTQTSGKVRVIKNASAPKGHAVNDIIPPSQRSAHLDQLRVSLPELRRLREQADDINRNAETTTQEPCKLVAWKVDIKSAYRLLPVHPLNQLLQILRVDNSFYVDWQMEFGNAAAPHIFTSFMSLLIWIAWYYYHLSLYVYMDDVYGYSLCTENECFSIQQQLWLDLLADLNIPVSLEKNVLSSLASILGIEVDCNAMTITLDSTARQKLVDYLVAIAAKPSQSISVKQWSSIAGWLNWAASPLPYLRPFLS